MKITSLASLTVLLSCTWLTSCDADSLSTTESTTQAPVVTRAPNPLQLDSLAPRSTQPRVTEDGPVLEFESVHKDFGKVPDTVDLEHGFQFTNTGSAPLTILDIKPSCGCTTTTLAKTTYAPGEGGSIDIVWAPKGHSKQSKTITVRSNSKRAPIMQLRISAEIEPFLVVTPPRAEFNLVQRDGPSEIFLSVECQDPELVIESLQCTSPDVEVTLVEPAKNGRATVRVAIKELTPTQGVRRLFPKVLIHARARIHGQGETINHTHEVPVMATIFDQLAPDPAFFAVGRILPNQTLRKEVIVSRPSGEPFTVKSATLANFSPADGSSVRFEPVVGSAPPSYKVILTCAAGSYEGPVRGQIVLETDLAEEPTLRLDAFGVAGLPQPK